MLIGVVPMEEDAFWLEHRHGDLSKTDGSGFDQSKEEVWESCDVFVVIATRGHSNTWMTWS